MNGHHEQELQNRVVLGVCVCVILFTCIFMYIFSQAQHHQHTVVVSRRGDIFQIESGPHELAKKVMF